MNLQQLNELDLNSIASWPKLAKGIFILFFCTLLGGGHLLLRDSKFVDLADTGDK